PLSSRSSPRRADASSRSATNGSRRTGSWTTRAFPRSAGGRAGARRQEVVPLLRDDEGVLALHFPAAAGADARRDAERAARLERGRLRVEARPLVRRREPNAVTDAVRDLEAGSLDDRRGRAVELEARHSGPRELERGVVGAANDVPRVELRLRRRADDERARR